MILGAANRQNNFGMASAWEQACKTGNLKECMISTPSLTIVDKNEGLKKSSRYGHMDIVNHFLKEGADPTDQYAYALRYACGNGHSEVVNTLIDKGYMTSTDSSSEPDSVTLLNVAFGMAVMFGRTQVVKTLLGIEGVDPAAQNSSALVNASMRGHADVVSVLCEDKRVNVNVRGAEAMEAAAAGGYDATVLRLLEYGCGSDTDILTRSFVLACTHLHPTTATILLGSKGHKNGDSKVQADVEMHKHTIPTSIVQGTLLFLVEHTQRDNADTVIQPLTPLTIDLISPIVDKTDPHIGVGNGDNDRNLHTNKYEDKFFRTNPHTSILPLTSQHVSSLDVKDINSVETLAERREKLITVLIDYLSACIHGCTQTTTHTETDTQENVDEEFVSVSEWLGTVLLYACRVGSQLLLSKTVAVYESIGVNEVVSKMWTEYGNECLKASAQKGFHEVLQYLLTISSIDPGCDDNYALIQSCGNGHVSTARLLLGENVSRRVDPSASDNKALRMACANGHAEIVQMLLKTRRVSTSANESECFRVACDYGQIAVVETLLGYHLQRVDIGARDNEAIRKACANGHLGIVKLLLSNEQSDPTAAENEAIRMACANGHYDVVDMLLRNPSVDPSVNYNEAIQKACENGHLDVVVRLLVDRRVDSSIDNDLPLRLACKNGHTRVVEVLLGRPKINPANMNNYALKVAAENGYADVLDILLGDDRVDVCADNQYALKEACRNGCLTVVELLLEEEDIDPANDNSVALTIAAKNGRKDVCNLLIRDGRVDQRAYDDVIAKRKASRRTLAKALRQYNPETIAWNGPAFIPVATTAPIAMLKDDDQYVTGETNKSETTSVNTSIQRDDIAPVNSARLSLGNAKPEIVKSSPPAPKRNILSVTPLDIAYTPTPTSTSTPTSIPTPTPTSTSIPTPTSTPTSTSTSTSTPTPTSTPISTRTVETTATVSTVPSAPPTPTNPAVGTDMHVTVCVLSGEGLSKKSGVFGYVSVNGVRGPKSKPSIEKNGGLDWESPISVTGKYKRGNIPPVFDIRLCYEARVTKSEKTLGVTKVILPNQSHNGNVVKLTLPVCDKRGIAIPRATVNIQVFYKPQNEP
eukprot:CFRG5631T1